MYKEAIVDYNITIHLEPNDYHAWFNRAMAEFNLDDANAGCDDLNKAKELGDPDAEEFLDELCSEP
jgi:hypothetical protein